VLFAMLLAIEMGVFIFILGQLVGLSLLGESLPLGSSL
jgi:hypothetical protein